MITPQDYEYIIKPSFIKTIWELFDELKPENEEQELIMRQKISKFIEDKHKIILQQPVHGYGRRK